MQVFKAYFKILKTQLISVLIYGGMFLILAVTFISNATVKTDRFEVKKIPIMVINKDGASDLIQGFLKYLEDYAVFVEPKKSETGIRDALYNREVSYILTIPAGFSESFHNEGSIILSKQTAPDSMEAITIDTAIDNYFSMAFIYEKYLPMASGEEISAYVKANLQEKTTVYLNVEQKDTVATGNNQNRYFFNYLGYIMIAMFITSVSTVMYSFHSLDLRRRHYASSMTLRTFNMQLIFANLVFVMCYLLFFIIAGYLLNENRVINTNTLLFWLNAVIFALVCLSVSYLVGISVKSKKAIGAISTAGSVGLAFLSGMFVPQEYLGATVLKVASFTPVYWFVRANNEIETVIGATWSNLSDIVSYMAIQLGFAVAIISIALVVSKRKRQQII